MEPDQVIVNIVGLAKEAEIFIHSNLGKYLLNKMSEKRDYAKDKLAVIDPSDVNEIVRLQNIVLECSDFNQWMFDLIQAGELAYEDYLSEGE